MSRLVVSTRNLGKLRELRALLDGLPLTVVTAAEAGVPDVEETGTTFLDNALLKAAAAWELAPGPCLADDSGLAVDALDGAPGVYSARFAGEDVTYDDNNRHLLARLSGVPEADRGAAFGCCLALLLPEALVGGHALSGRVERPEVPDGAVLVSIEGRVAGRILETPRGEGGFGYDPLFWHEPSAATFAEMDPAAKNAISHRGQALAGLRACLELVYA